MENLSFKAKGIKFEESSVIQGDSKSVIRAHFEVFIQCVENWCATVITEVAQGNRDERLIHSWESVLILENPYSKQKECRSDWSIPGSLKKFKTSIQIVR
jgi:hypothetical protein